MKAPSTRLFQRCITTEKSAMPHVHYHDAHELYYMVNGSTTYYIGDKIFRVQAGNFIFIPKGILHKTDYEVDDNHERIIINFGDKLFGNDLQELREELMDCRLIYIEKDKMPYFKELLDRMEAESARDDSYNSTLMHLYVKELLVQLCRHKYHYKPTLSGTDQAIYAISKYIRMHFHENITLGELSREFAMSESHLSRKFKAHTGIGINEYITYVRITNAERLLLETELSVTEVADRCGYSDSNYFSTVFKRIKGVSPQKIRKQG